MEAIKGADALLHKDFSPLREYPQRSSVLLLVRLLQSFTAPGNQGDVGSIQLLVVLALVTHRERPDAGRKFGRNVHHFLAEDNEVLCTQVTPAACNFHHLAALCELFRPAY